MNTPAFAESPATLQCELPEVASEFGNSAPGARQRRLHRTSAAEFLVRLNSPCTQQELASIDWDSLEAVPHWCFLAPDVQRFLQLLCGAVFAGPSMVRWIDGERIQLVCRLIGHQAFARIISAVPHPSEPDASTAGSVESLLLECGASVLLGAVPHSGIQVLLRALFDESVTPLDTPTAKSLYQQALAIYDLELAQQMPEPTAAPVESEQASSADSK